MSDYGKDEWTAWLADGQTQEVINELKKKEGELLAGSVDFIHRDPKDYAHHVGQYETIGIVLEYMQNLKE